jgi:hypothetical protein
MSGEAIIVGGKFISFRTGSPPPPPNSQGSIAGTQGQRYEDPMDSSIDFGKASVNIPEKRATKKVGGLYDRLSFFLSL